MICTICGHRWCWICGLNQDSWFHNKVFDEFSICHSINDRAKRPITRVYIVSLSLGLLLLYLLSPIIIILGTFYGATAFATNDFFREYWGYRKMAMLPRAHTQCAFVILFPFYIIERLIAFVIMLPAYLELGTLLLPVFLVIGPVMYLWLAFRWGFSRKTT